MSDHMESVYLQFNERLHVTVWKISKDHEFFDIELLDKRTGEEIKVSYFDGTLSDAIEEAKQWLKTF